jgi:hypothetical protein
VPRPPFPATLRQFQIEFASEEACQKYLAQCRWPEGFVAAIYAGVIGIGCAIGLRRMMHISRGIAEAELEHTVNWHLTLDGLEAASDRVVRLMDRLDLPNLARRLPDQLHTSSDGQKFEVRVDSLNANYSFKYFGKEQGVAAYTFRDERDLLWYSTVFSAAERGKRLRHRRTHAQRGRQK